MADVRILREKRITRFQDQQGLCYYCEQPMWEAHFETKREALQRFFGDKPANAGARSPLQLSGYSKEEKLFIKYRLCTLEHLDRRVNGGGNHHQNLVAACNHCNSDRQDMPPDQYKQYIREKLNATEPTKTCD